MTYWWGRERDGEWTETDLIAHQALTILEASRCGCGCGGWAEECTDRDLQDVWLAKVGRNYRQAALVQAREDRADELKTPGAFVYLWDSRQPGPEPEDDLG